MDDLTRTIERTVASAIEAQAKAEFLKALGGTDHLVDRFLKVASTYKVKRDYRDVPLLDACIEDTVTRVVGDMVNELVNEHRDDIKKAIASRLRSTSKDVANQMVDHVFGRSGLHIRVINRGDE